MGKKDFMKGMGAGAKPFEEKFERLSEDTRKIGEKVNEKIDDLGDVIDVVIDDMSDIRKKELYHLNTPYDLKEDLDDDEKEILAALLLRLSEFAENNEEQKKFIRSVNAYIEVKSPQSGLDISCIENIENINVQKMMLQVTMEYLYLGTEDFSFLEEFEDEVFAYFSVNRKGIREIEEYIKAIYQAVGKEGMAEKYGFVPKEQPEETAIDAEIFKLYKETTPYNLQKDLTDTETEVLGGLLAVLKEETGCNELQQNFLSVIASEGEIILISSEEEPDLDNVENMNSQKIMLQILMEYGFLGAGDFAFLENEVFDSFSVNKKGINQIKNRIQKVYDERGAVGILEKYKYMCMEELGESLEREDVEDIREYLEISQVCSDRVNLHKFAELNAYLVYLDEENNTLYKVHKQTGERTKVRKTGGSGEIKDFCGAGSRICISIGKIIKIINVDTNEERDIEIVYEPGNRSGYNYFGTGDAKGTGLQCNGRYLIYNTTVKESDAIVYVDFKNFNSELIADDRSVSIHSSNIFLEKDMLYMIVDEDSEEIFDKNRILYQYDLMTGKVKQLLQVGGISSFADYKAENMLCGRSIIKYKEYLIGYCSDGYEIDLWYLNIYNMEDKKIRKVSFEDDDECFLEGEIMNFEKYMILFTEAGAIWKYDIFSEELTMVVEESDCVDSYTKGIINTTTIYNLNMYEDDVNLLNNTLYFRPNSEGTVYKAPINECSEQAEAL